MGSLGAAEVVVRGENICFIALAPKVGFFSKSALPRTKGDEAPCPMGGDRWLTQAHGHASQGHLPREEQNYHLQISVSLTLLSERLKCFTCEIKS